MADPMTPERRAEIEKMTQRMGSTLFRSRAVADCLAEIDRLNAAVLAEREACAKIADASATAEVRGLSVGPEASMLGVVNLMCQVVSEGIARDIRARSEAKP